MRRLVFIAPGWAVVVCCFVPGLFLADCSNDPGKSPCIRASDAATMSISCATVTVPEAEAGSVDATASSDEVVAPESDGAFIDVAADVDAESWPQTDASHDQAAEVPAFVVPPCPVLPTACDPVGNVLCPSAALNCYLTDVASTVCTCPTSDGDNGAPCRTYSDCLPGLTCVAEQVGAVTGTCRAACYVSNPICPIAGTSCLPIVGGATLGYCG